MINIILLVAIFYASTSLTINFFASFGEGNVKISNLILAIVNDSCKVFFPLCLGYMINKEKYIHAFLILTMTVGAVGFSYLASQGTDLNLNNKIIIESSNKDEIKGMKNDIKDKIEKLEVEKNNELEKIQHEIVGLPTNYVTKKKELMNLKVSINKDYNSRIEKLENKSFVFDEELLKAGTGKNLTTKGYGELSKALGIEVKDIVNWKNIFLEILAVALSINLGTLMEKQSLKFNFKKVINKTQKKQVEIKKDTDNDNPKKKLRLV
jgi:hypothetical protein